MQEELKKEKSRLVEKLGVHFENIDNLAPVAARILAYVILTGKQGTTFEDLVSNLCASKSTISTHLNHLYDLKKLEYFTKTGDRKKYYIINHATMLQGIEKLLNEWKEQKELHAEIIDFKRDVNTTLEEEVKFSLDFHEDYMTFLNGAINAITTLKNKIVENE